MEGGEGREVGEGGRLGREGRLLYILIGMFKLFFIETFYS